MGEQGSEPLEPVAWHTPELLPWETLVQIRQLWLLEKIYGMLVEGEPRLAEWGDMKLCKVFEDDKILMYRKDL